MSSDSFYQQFEALSPFEIKDELIKLAKTGAENSSAMFLNAGRGNPNWIATRSREAFFLLGQFALTEAKLVTYDERAGLAGMPAVSGCHARLKEWAKRREGDPDTPGAETLASAVDFAIEKFGFEPDEFVHELTDSIIGDNYPVPGRAEVQQVIEKRYTTLTPAPRDLKFIDRIMADSRDVALNHTAGVSLPQQIMMMMFSLVEMMDEEKVYQKACMDICDRRFRAVVEAMGIEVEPREYYARYYGIIDFEFWLRKYIGDDVVEWVKDNIHPLDIAFKLAEDHGIVLLNGSGFSAPGWSARVPFANLDDEAYSQIGRAVRAVARGYVQAFRAAKGLPVQT